MRIFNVAVWWSIKQFNRNVTVIYKIRDVQLQRGDNALPFAILT